MPIENNFPCIYAFGKEQWASTALPLLKIHLQLLLLTFFPFFFLLSRLSSLIISCLFQSRLQPGKNKPASLAKAKHTWPNYQLPHCSFGLAGILPAFVLLPAPCLRAASFDSAPCSQAEQDPAGKLRKGYFLPAPRLWITAVYLPAELPAGIHLCEEPLCFGIRENTLFFAFEILVRVEGSVGVPQQQPTRYCRRGAGYKVTSPQLCVVLVCPPASASAGTCPECLGKSQEGGWHCPHSRALPQLSLSRQCVGAARWGPAKLPGEGWCPLLPVSTIWGVGSGRP